MKEGIPQVHIEFGSHKHSGGSTFQTVENAIDNSLVSGNSQSAVFIMEMVDYTGSQVKQFERFVKYDGKLPSQAIQLLQSSMGIRSIPSDFLNQQYELSDRLAVKHKGKFIPSFEIMNARDPLSSNRMHEKYIRSMYEGNFDQALILFKKSMADMNQRDEKREDDMVDRIEDLVKHGRFVGLRFGSLHTRIFHLLKARGINVERSFPELESHKFVYPGSLVLRRKLMLTDYQPTELEWMQWMIADMMSNEVMFRNIDDTNAEFSNILKQIPSKFKTIDDIRAFESTVKNAFQNSKAFGPEQFLESRKLFSL